MSKELTPQKEAGCSAAFPDEPPLSPKKEFFRIRHELGQLLKYAREQERLSAQAIAEQNGLSGTAELLQLERGRCKNLWKYFQLVNYFGLQLHPAMDYIDENRNKKLRREQAEDSKFWFLRMWSGILQQQRKFHHYTLEKLSAATGIPAERIKTMEEKDNHGEFSLDDACLLMAYFNKSLIPEAYRLE